MESPFVSIADHGLAPTRSGKVREVLDLGDQLLMITTDRISAFDCVLPTPVPGKGKLLNRISNHWFRTMREIVPNHVVSDQEPEFPRDLVSFLPVLRDRWVLVRKAERIDVECVVRGFLAGSGMREYRDKGTVGGIEVPAGIPDYGELPEPLFTPTTKEDVGHDRPVTYEELCDRIGSDLAGRLRDLSIRIFRDAGRRARERGLLLADTKFEFGWIDGDLCLIDELLTPDSSRYWDGDGPRDAEPEPLDKEYVRGYLKGLDWDRNPPAPPLPREQIAETYRRYLRVYDALGVGTES
ncbi:MAG: phosphoribosylaminoimidazolesuccinocarboxamide synthase [Candidatus Eisenbacteria bacterium]|nr:phosphoribosylaminoimidazolesuccinocarboxamide synthase [Candidatus Latescibacterota bacterium]MBD3301814.1 phosphoribosylaminoimidazolesuccinocarboxamide synthase [Candidatus Eisenbacteria bacterium]